MVRALTILAMGLLLTVGVHAEAPPAPPGAQRIALPLGEQAGSALLWAETLGTPKGAVVLVPDLDTPADWPQVIGPLRSALPAAGWSVLVLEMPGEWGLEAGERVQALDAAHPLLAAAVAHLGGMGAERIVLAGHGFGALAAADFLRAGRSPRVSGLVLISTAGLGDDPRLNAATALAGVTVPTLDLYGERDLAPVRAGADRRAVAARKALPAQPAGSMPTQRPRYRQVAIPGATHDFTGYEQTLARRVRGWLERHVGAADPQPMAAAETAPPQEPAAPAEPPAETIPPAQEETAS